MPRFAYYNKLSRKQQEIYRRSDAIEMLQIPRAGSLLPDLQRLAAALSAGNRAQTQRVASAVLRALTDRLELPAANVKVLAKRPSNDWGELHGLYDPETARISVWMRTAQRRQIVAFKTFLRTLLHEFCHHLDYTLFKLEDSFHTEGFYKRESSVYKQMLQVIETGVDARQPI